VLFDKAASILVVLDSVEGGAGEQSWHLGSEDDARRFSFAAPAERIATWRSRALCSKEPAIALKVPAQVAVIDLGPDPAPSQARVAGNQVLWNGRAYTL